ncbi:MAG TPA: hypothetical protein DCZ12_17885 [Gammaproteobacteria bacterium]|nr:hypothetical protein [Gammaproteobacteria bacterium]
MNRQAGLGLIAWIIVIAFAAAIITTGIRVLPVYIDHMAVKDIINDLQRDSSNQNISKREIRLQLHKRFKTNSLWDLDPDQIIKVIKDKERGLIFHVQYEVRKPVVGNVDLIVSFDEKIGSQI